MKLKLFCFRQKRPAADFIDPLANKKPRISHLASKAATPPVNGKISSSNGRGDAGSTPSGVVGSAPDGGTPSSSQQLPMLDIPRPFEALSDVSNDSSNNGRDCDSQESAVPERFSQPPSLPQTSSPRHTILEAPRDKSSSSLNTKSKKKSKKHKDKEKSKDKEKVREKEQENERKSRDECVSEPNRACETSLGNLKSNSIPHRSTGENNTHTHTVFYCVRCGFLNKSDTWYLDALQLVITVSRWCIMWRVLFLSNKLRPLLFEFVPQMHAC